MINRSKILSPYQSFQVQYFPIYFHDFSMIIIRIFDLSNSINDDKRQVMPERWWPSCWSIPRPRPFFVTKKCFCHKNGCFCLFLFNDLSTGSLFVCSLGVWDIWGSCFRFVGILFQPGEHLLLREHWRRPWRGGGQQTTCNSVHLAQAVEVPWKFDQQSHQQSAICLLFLRIYDVWHEKIWEQWAASFGDFEAFMQVVRYCFLWRTLMKMLGYAWIMPAHSPEHLASFGFPYPFLSISVHLKSQFRSFLIFFLQKIATWIFYQGD